MNAFHDIRFPLDVSLGSSGGPERRTDIITLTSGHEERNALWHHSRRRYNAGYGIHSLDDIHEIIAFFEARQGRLNGFRWRDPMDWKSCAPSKSIDAADQMIGTGDGVNVIFQIKKTYQSGSASWERIITKPVLGMVKVQVSGVHRILGTDFTLNENGAIVFASYAVPAQNAPVEAGFEFDVPVRFDTDYLAIDLAAFQAGQIPEIPLIEIRQ